MKIAVIGCGAMGCYFGAKLSEKNEVIFIDQLGKTVDTLNKDGITILENNEKKSYKAPTFLSGKYKENVDLVLLFVKSTQNISALSENEALLNDNTIVLSLQNGYNNEREIMRYVLAENIVQGTTSVTCTKDDGIIKVQGTNDLIIGTFSNDKKALLTAKVLLQQAGFKAEQSQNLKRTMWEMLLVNGTLSPLTALFNCKTRVIYENKNIWQIVQELVQELVEVAAVDGEKFNVEEVLDTIQTTCINAGKGVTAMQQDVLNKRFTEIERINGQVSMIAYRNKVKTPNNEFVINAIKALERLY